MRTIIKMNYKSYIKYLVLLILLYFPIFSHMESMPIRMFDEARLAINAYEMHKDGNFIVTHYEGEPEMWNTKPPLMIWSQVFSMKLFGVRELSVRLPSAIAALLTCIFLLFVSIRYLKDFWFGFISSVILISSIGYMNVHAVRTGDYDSLLTLFTTLYSLLFFIYIHTGKLKYLYFTFIAIILAVLTKGIGGMLFLPILLGYAIIQQKAIELLKSKHLYIGIGLFILFVFGYYLLREHYNPGYLKAVKDNELGGRYLNTIENHKEGFWFYYRMLVDHHLLYWYLLVPCGFVVGIFHKKRIYRLLAMYTSALVLFYFLVISLGQTKLEWYPVPMYPFLTIIIAMFVHLLFTFIQDSKIFTKLLRVNVLPYIFLFIICIIPYSEIVNRTFSPKVFPWEEDLYRIDYYLKDAIKGKNDVNGYTLLQNDYGAHNMFYIHILRDKGVNINQKYEWKNLNVNDMVIAHQDIVKDYITKNYSVDIIKSYYNIFFYKINGKLKP